MNAYVTWRTVLFLALCFSLTPSPHTLAQDVGGDIGAGIFRPKNPETKKRTTKPATPVVKPGNRASTRPTRVPAGPSVADRVEELLDKGNSSRDERRFDEAETAYKGVFELDLEMHARPMV